ncbi:uncharacterized protein C8A04DRAFT_12252 [Dichotomopilus funicola]|uniref:Uncharacterized protein n=1 Tax=Dichotomopilus funicola TaxID=1934379 RepID=A0AAN6V306_9PEZI|nr:hypothetical protein C8A04DRAFT_12252 [Dichotomopilus funicola]
MDPHDDPSTTTTTTDYDSGDSVSVDYVYEGQRVIERPPVKGKSPRRKRSPKAKSRGGPTKCICGAGAGAGQGEDDAESTVFEEDSDTEEERTNSPKQPKAKHSGPCAGSACKAKSLQHGKGKKKATTATTTTATTAATTETRARRARTPYIEDYPEEPRRPAILLREHTILRRGSTSDVKRVRDSDDGSSVVSRNRSPMGKKAQGRLAHRPSIEPVGKPTKATAKHHKRHSGLRDPISSSGSEIRGPQSDSEDSHPSHPRARHIRQNTAPDVASIVSRSSAWTDPPQIKPSSSWPLRAESQLPPRRLERRNHDYDSEEERKDFVDNTRHHCLRQIRAAPSFHHRGRDKDHEPSQDMERWTAPPSEYDSRIPERGPRLRYRSRSRVAPSHGDASMATIDQGYRSVATSMCEVWRGKADDWESPYVSVNESDFESDTEKRRRFPRMEDLPSRRPSPRTLPPRGDARDFGFRARNHSPPAYRHRPHYNNHSSAYTDEPGFDASRTLPWAASKRDGIIFLDEQHPLPALTMEPAPMWGDDDEDDYADSEHEGDAPNPRRLPPPPSSFSSSTQSRGPVLPPVFSARETREFLSPKPTRAVPARFDFDAWGCGWGSRNELELVLR